MVHLKAFNKIPYLLLKWIAILKVASSQYYPDSTRNINDGNFTLTSQSGKTLETISISYYESFEKIQWFKNNDDLISTNNSINTKFDNKYEVYVDSSNITLMIKNLSLEDSSNYTLEMKINEDYLTFNVELFVEEKSEVTIEDNNYAMIDESVQIVCKICGYPPSESVKWMFRPCTNILRWDDCVASTETPQEIKVDRMYNQALSLTYEISVIRFIPTHSGLIFCESTNKFGSTIENASIILSDIEKPFLITGYSEDQPITLGDDITLNCSCTIYNCNLVTWFLNDRPIKRQEGRVSLYESATSFSYSHTLNFKNISKDDSGLYQCNAGHENSTVETLEIFLMVNDPEPPVVFAIPNETVVQIKHNENYFCRCKASGLPIPKITWYKDGELMESNKEDSKRCFKKNSLCLRSVTNNDAGVYKCVAESRAGSNFLEITIQITDSPVDMNLIAVICFGILVLLLVVFAIYHVHRMRIKMKEIEELRAAGLADFFEGNTDRINKDLPLDEQASLLPYDQDFEFPRENLQLGKQLGEGAFGVVVQAVAQGIITSEDATTVAVKMVKHKMNNEAMYALVSELKIMVHVGQHMNIVNLLGAITKNIGKRELMVIVEYCPFGNIQHFLIKHRSVFQDHFAEKDDILNDKSRYTRDPSIKSRAKKNENGYVRRASQMGNSYTGNEVKRSLSTTDLICWAYQVARGMSYLNQRRILHGDLAARNILLGENNIVKICDFGLAKALQKSDNYRKSGNPLLPVKWLAIESITDRLFSTYSDVWAYGVLLWEIFSLARTPYPELDADEKFRRLLEDGYRMEKPEYANDDIYDIMLTCWKYKPDTRPSFDELEKLFAAMMDESVKEHYIVLNEQYLTANIKCLEDRKIDYLAMMSSPTNMAPRAPKYMNTPDISVRLSKIEIESVEIQGF